jgi:hypothetical protein
LTILQPERLVAQGVLDGLVSRAVLGERVLQV